MVRQTSVRGILNLVNTVSISFILFSLGVLIIQAVHIYQAAAANPFYGPTTTSAWLCDPESAHCERHMTPANGVYVAREGAVFPLGRTICSTHLVDATIYKEIDDAHGGTWPISGYSGSGERDLVRGCQDRISPTIIPPVTPRDEQGAPPPGPGYVFRVWFNVDRGGLPPLIVPLQVVQMTLLPPAP